MSDHSAGLRLTKTTSPRDLEKFLENRDENSKVRGTRHDDRTVTLFISDRPTGVWGEFTGWSKEREAASEILGIWSRFRNVPNLSPEAKQVLDSRTLSVGEVRRLASELQVGDKQVPRDNRRGRHQGPPPLPIDYKQIPVDDKQIPRDDGLQVPRGPFPRDGVLIPGKDGSIRPPLKLTFNGVDYIVNTKSLGGGGQGNVYEAVSETGEKVVIKVPHQDKIEEAEREFLVHQRAIGPDHDQSHVVGLKGAATGGDGRIQAIMLEHMPGGDAKKLLTRLRDAELTGKISHEDARLIRLTIARDMASGLAQLHQARSLLHFDIKPDNFLIGSDGVVRLSDFGTSVPEGEMRGRTAAAFEGTANYASPEAHGAVGRIEALEKKIEDLDKEIRRLESRPNEVGFTKEVLVGHAKELREEIDKTSIDAKSDVFSLGLSLAYAFEGTNLGGRQHHSPKMRSALKDVRSLGNDNSPERNEVLDHLGITSDSPEHKLIREMLSVNPKDRPTAQQVVDRLPPDGEIGSPRIRGLLFDVAQGKLA